jgi:hypothetical protein
MSSRTDLPVVGQISSIALGAAWLSGPEALEIASA